jgi:lysine-N-methylase
MKLVVPRYYADFKCVGGSCSDNCCIGWEIDIDGETREKYFSLDTPLGERIRKNTAIDEGVCHFVMQGERCPFLNSENLCDIICEMGDGALCDICREHPRYYTVLDDTVYGGVGLSCEAAAELILGDSFPHEYTTLETDGESEECDEELYEIFLALRKSVSEIFGDGNQSMVYIKKELSKAVSRAQAKADGMPKTPCEIKDFSRVDLVDIVEKCELLTDELPSLLRSAEGLPKHCESINNYLQNLLLYFLDRYLPKAVEDGDFVGKLKLALFSLSAIEHLFCTEKDLTLGRAVYLSKLYSKEIEYNEDNIMIIESTVG